ncbi:MAG: FecR domain-containing protein [Planctomycetia bacterium]|nr:FecR domain-containing protein [Planctomycetia bacterium]
MSRELPLDDAARQAIDELLDGGFAGAAAAAADLLARLDGDADAREYLLERAALHAGLRQSLRRRRLAAWAMARERAAAGRGRLRLAGLGGIAAAACLLVGLAAWRSGPAAYAIVKIGVGTPGLATGAALRGEKHRLMAGVLELETSRGAQIVIEAPAAFCFESPHRLRLTEGRVAADVPARAKGFSVVTPSGEAIDLGTRFAVDVPASGEAEVHVFDGEVVARGGGNRRTSLREGEAFSLAANRARQIRSAAFIRRGEVPELAAAVAAGQERRSRDTSLRLREDPALVALVDFEADGPPGPAGSGEPRPDGQYRMVQGRWPGSRAADFTGVGDHLRLDVGGDADWPRLTIAAWVRLDRLGDPYQSLYHTDHWTNNPGQVHWMIVAAGVMRLALPDLELGPDAVEKELFPESRTTVFGAEGRWMHLATVYDSHARSASFYVDGRHDGTTLLAEAPPARLGPARIGNWNQHDRKLSGRIDELVILGRALDAGEIRSLYDAGVPYR